MNKYINFRKKKNVYDGNFYMIINSENKNNKGEGKELFLFLFQ